MTATLIPTSPRPTRHADALHAYVLTGPPSAPWLSADCFSDHGTRYRLTYHAGAGKYTCPCKGFRIDRPCSHVHQWNTARQTMAHAEATAQRKHPDLAPFWVSAASRRYDFPAGFRGVGWDFLTPPKDSTPADCPACLCPVFSLTLWGTGEFGIPVMLSMSACAGCGGEA